MSGATRILAATALICASPAIVAMASQPSAQQMEKLRSVLFESDVNGDGKVTRREYNAYRADVFARLDRNNNNVVSEQDAPRIRIAKRKFDSKLEQVLAVADKNGDGMLSRAEWDNPERDIFELVDQDGDGVIILSELPRPN